MFPLTMGMAKSILAKSKQASCVPGSNHKEAFKTKDLEISILYFPPDWGGCDLFLFTHVHFRRAYFC